MGHSIHKLGYYTNVFSRHGKNIITKLVRLSYPKYFIKIIDSYIFKRSAHVRIRSYLISHFSHHYQSLKVQPTDLPFLVITSIFDHTSTTSYPNVIQPIGGYITNLFKLSGLA